jgi:hypothetical protein
MEIELNPRWRPNKKKKRTSITTVRDQYLSYATFATPLIFPYPLPLSIPWCAADALFSCAAYHVHSGVAA